MDYENIIFDVAEGVASVTLNRPRALNAIQWRTMEETLAVIENCRQRDDVRVLVFTGTGRAFSSGDDLKDMGPWKGNPEPEPAEAFRALHHEVNRGLLSLPKPVVALINGLVHGAGFTLTLACDYRIIADDTPIGDIRARRAIFAGTGASYLLPLVVGHARSVHLLTTGEVITGNEAAQMGLVTKSIPPERFKDEAHQFVRSLAEGPTRTIGSVKLTLNGPILARFDKLVDDELRPRTELQDSEDLQEGIESFREKRAPRFKGR